MKTLRTSAVLLWGIRWIWSQPESSLRLRSETRPSLWNRYVRTWNQSRVRRSFHLGGRRTPWVETRYPHHKEAGPSRYPTTEHDSIRSREGPPDQDQNRSSAEELYRRREPRYRFTTLLRRPCSRTTNLRDPRLPPPLGHLHLHPTSHYHPR